MDLATLIKGIIILLVLAGVIAFVCYILIRILSKFFSGFGEWAWIVWCIGGLVWLLALIRVFNLNFGLW
jgi:predicted PurR-regulated permease PerM